MVLTVYYDVMSQPCRSVLLFCEVNGIPYEKEVVSIGKGEHMSEEFSQINPENKLPAIKDGLFCLRESVAILKYLAAKYNTADHWYPRDLQKRAKVDEYLAWHHGNTRKDAIFVFWTEVLIPRMRGTEINQPRLKKAVAAFDNTMDKIEKIFLKDQKFLCGDDITLADIMAVPEFLQLTASGRDIAPDSPKINAWIERVRSRLQPFFDQFHTPIYKMRQKRLAAKESKL
ncbi:glutathione S-transferase theta-1-like [Saccoglossus kowalevskii]|uniref:Glutathione S-transferase theta-1-like n=1 Tax=Saccoglossus kowalevskii TaxID=10224 RepID=A0ABM0MQQ4_SACKO|nr:PREDICTED: glutathione S-transferase theta-1-like [Saccoglossus kowalevskii]